MTGELLSARDLTQVAARFKLLAEPARLRLLQCLHPGPQHVSALIAATGLRQANLSKHLQALHAHGIVGRTQSGRFVHYTIADPGVVALCDLMCRQVAGLSVDRRIQTASRTARVRGSRSGGRTRPARATR